MAKGALVRGARFMSALLPSLVHLRKPRLAQAALLATSPRMAALASERNLVVDFLVEAAFGSRLAAAASGAVAVAGRRVARLILLVHARAGTGATAARIQHRQRAVEVLQHDFRAVFVLAVLALPFAGLQRALDVDLGALLQILLGDLAQVLVEDHDRVPFGCLAALARGLVAPGLGGGDAQVGDGTAILRAADLGI